MASSLSRCCCRRQLPLLQQSLLTFFLVLTCASSLRIPTKQPSFSTLRVLQRTPQPQQDNDDGVVHHHRYERVVFEVRGSDLHRGLPVKTTDSPATCRTTPSLTLSSLNVTELRVYNATRAHYAILLPLSNHLLNVYFCLPTYLQNNEAVQLNDFLISSSDRWIHQGFVVSIRASGYSDDPDTDLHFDDLKQRQKRQAEEEDDEGTSEVLRIRGLRVDSCDKEPHFDPLGIPMLLVGVPYTLRLFGSGFTQNTVVTFTQQEGKFGSSCQIPVTGAFPIEKGSVHRDTAQVTVKLPAMEHAGTLYICVKEGNASVAQSVRESNPFVHQGSKPWLAVHSTVRLIPLWVAMLIIVVCLCFSALFSGLNLGLMSLDRTELKILCNTGTEQERKYAKKIQPVRNHGNFLLCSILLGNVLVNSTFTILLDDLTSGVVAIVCSTLAIVMFGEITPQAICSRHGLAVGAKTIIVTKCVMVITFPLAYPISKILDIILGEEIGSVYTRERLKELVKVTTGENDLDRDEVNIISGALELRKKTVADVMTRIEDAFMLSYYAILDFETVSEIMKSGYSRIPVYDGDRKNIVTTLYIKDLAFVDPDDNTPLKTLCQFYQNPCNFVFEDVTLDIMFREFKEGNKGHMAFINRVNTEGEGDPFYETIGLITLEDVIEELIQAEIMDETDVFTDNRTKRRRTNADRMKQDFTVFADRRAESNRIRISPQLTLATFQYLSTSIDLFKPPGISETILRRMLKQDIYHHVKKNKDWRNDPSTLIYQQKVPADYFVLILEGRVEVRVGNENLTFESGPFTYFGTQALMSVVMVESPTTIGSLQSIHADTMSKMTFQPDYTVRGCTEVLYLKLKRNLFMAAKRASLMELSQKDACNGGGSVAANDAFDDEVEKFKAENDELPEFLESDELLHSLGDEDSIGRRSPDLKNNSISQANSPNTPSLKSQLQMSPTNTTTVATTSTTPTTTTTATVVRNASGRELNGTVKSNAASATAANLEEEGNTDSNAEEEVLLPPVTKKS